MTSFKQFDLALAKFAGYPLWPVRILKITKNDGKRTNYLIFCYGDHNEQIVSENNLVSYKDNIQEASTKTAKNVKHAFEELERFPDIYRSISKAFAALKVPDQAAALPGSQSALFARISATEQELEKTRESIVTEITRQVSAKCGSNAKSGLKDTAETIISELYKSVSLEFNPILDRIERELKMYRMQTRNLENRIEKIEVKLDDIDQENMLDSLVFNGLKQKPGVDLKTTMLSVLSTRMGVTGISSGELSSVFRFRMNGPHTTSDKVAPVLVRFVSKEVARKVFLQKSKLAGSGIFVSESLTKRRRDLLNAARDRFGVKNVWTDRGNILVKLPGEPSARKIRSLAECV